MYIFGRGTSQFNGGAQQFGKASYLRERGKFGFNGYFNINQLYNKLKSRVGDRLKKH